MEVKNCRVDYAEEHKETMTLTVEHDERTYVVEFEFIEASTAPYEHSPFPTGDTKKYAWPAEKIPDAVQFDMGTDEAVLYTMGGVPGVPEDTELLVKPYNEVENANRSPFVNYE